MGAAQAKEPKQREPVGEAVKCEAARSQGIPVPCASTARSKLAYLLGPDGVAGEKAKLQEGGSHKVPAEAAGAKPVAVVDSATSEQGHGAAEVEEDEQRSAKRLRELTTQLDAADAVNEGLRAELKDLRERLAGCGAELPPTQFNQSHSGPALRLEAEGRAVVAKRPASPPALLGIRSPLCRWCRKAEAQTDRVFAESGEIFCQDCWTKWERSGWWRPSVRISCAPPPVRTPGGLPQYGKEDAFFLPGFLCAHDDLSLFHALKDELPDGRDFSDWHGGRHLGLQFQGGDARHQSATKPPVLRDTVARLEAAFGIEASASRLNLYRSTEDYKPLHFDRGRDENGVPQVTVGASFGATRELTLCHVKSGVTATFPQRNGDVFAFTPELNTVFTHGVPKIGFGSPSLDEGSGPRLSLILWGSKVGGGQSHGTEGAAEAAGEKEAGQS